MIWASQVALVVKNLPANSGDVRDTGSITESRRSPGGGHGNPLQYSSGESKGQRSLAGSVDLIVHEVAERRTRLSDLARAHMRDSHR